MHIFQQQIANPLSPYPREWFPDPDGTVFFDIETTVFPGGIPISTCWGPFSLTEASGS